MWNSSNFYRMLNRNPFHSPTFFSNASFLHLHPHKCIQLFYSMIYIISNRFSERKKYSNLEKLENHRDRNTETNLSLPFPPCPILSNERGHEIQQAGICQNLYFTGERASHILENRSFQKRKRTGGIRISPASHL